MATVTIGKLDFDAKAYNLGKHYFEKYLIELVLSIRDRKKLEWSCKDQAFVPPNAPQRFKNVEPHLLVYHNDLRRPEQRKLIKNDSAAAGWALVKDAGFRSGDAFEQDINDRFGVQDIPFDVDAAISPLKAFHLKIKVLLEYRHFQLHSPALAPRVIVILSIPDRVIIQAKKEHLCIPGGPAPLPNLMKHFRRIKETYVRSKTPDAFDLRREDIEEHVKYEKDLITKAKARLKQYEEQLEAIKPSSD